MARPATNHGDARVDLLNAVDAALQYDYLQDKYSAADSLAGIVKQHLTQRFTDYYLVRRPVVELLAKDADVGRQVLLIGANGSGKTAALLALNRYLSSNLSGLSEPIDMVVFNGNRNAGSLAQRQTVNEKRVFILQRLASAIEKRLLLTPSSALRREWQTYLTSSDPLFAGFNTVYMTETVAGDLPSLLRDNRSAAERWLNAYDEWRRQPIVDRLKPMINYHRTCGRRMAVAIDNCDHLRMDDLRAACDATRDLFTVTGNVLSVVIAVRPPTRDRIRPLLNIANMKDRFVTSFDLVEYDADQWNTGERSAHWRPSMDRIRLDLQHTYEIFTRRLDVFNDPVSANKLENFASQTSGSSGRDPYRGLLASFRRAARVVLEDYFLFDGTEVTGAVDETAPSHAVSLPRADSRRQPEYARDDLTRIFTMWHNGSVRELATSLLDYLVRHSGPKLIGPAAASQALDTADALMLARQPNHFQDRAGVNARTALFRHVFFHGTTQADLDNPNFPEIHASCLLFSLTHARGSDQCVFPGARILQYLHHNRARNGLIVVNDVREVLGRVGLDDAHTDRALMSLCWRQAYGSGLTRVDGLVFTEGGEPMETTLRGEETVEILPAGTVLISKLAYVVEYNFWCAVAEPRARQLVAASLRLNEEDLVQPDILSRPNSRVRVALAYLARVLLPRLARDHPYMLASADPSQSDIDRLQAHCEFFGFGPNDWHISRCLQQVRRFLGVPVGDDDALGQSISSLDAGESQAHYEQLVGATGRLDAVYRLG